MSRRGQKSGEQVVRKRVEAVASKKGCPAEHRTVALSGRKPV